MLFGAGFALLIFSTVLVIARPDRALSVAVGLTAQTLCSEVFVSGLPPEPAFRESVASRAGLDLVAWGIRYKVDRSHQSLSASWLGLGSARAIYRGDAGCQLNSIAKAAPQLVQIEAGPKAWVLAPPDPKIETALSDAFAEPPTGSRRGVRAIVVIHNGQIVGERYAAGIGPTTALPGYSLTKTAIAALAGIEVGKGLLKMDAPVPISKWRTSGDLRATITPDQLLRMTSGLDAAETHSGFDPTSRMLFLEPDMAGYAEALAVKAPPGQIFSYQSPNTLILSRIIADQAGGTETAVLNFVRRELFSPLGMTTSVLETDPSGTPVGSQGMLASARDWGRLGELLLDGGQIGQRQTLPKDWVSYMTSSTLGLPYGAGIWLSQADIDMPQSRITRQSMPAGSFYASGDLGQRIYVVPSAHLVVVRLATSSGPDFGLRADMKLIGAVIAATKVHR